MRSNDILKILILVLVIELTSARIYGERVKKNIRVKRAKYYSNPPPHFYRRPPPTFAMRGLYSYTPPPPHLMDDEERIRPPIWSRPSGPMGSRPPGPMVNDGLGDEDINNIVKYLSKKDLEKIVRNAGEKLQDKRKEESSFDYNNSNRNPHPFHERPFNDKKYSSKYNENQYAKDTNYKKSSVEFNPSLNYAQDSSPKQIYSNPPDLPHLQNANFHNFPDQPSQSFPFEYEELNQNNPLQFINAFISNEVNEKPPSNLYQEETVKESQLPKPVNLREPGDYEVSYTKKIPKVIRAESYKLENFANLPLMNYDSKLDTVSSYHVPHYTITKSKASPPPPPSPSYHASSPSSSHEEGDANLKAVRIWAHRSTGTAYTLHDDGTLSLEQPAPSATRYGAP